jgi:hypothetical protein
MKNRYNTLLNVISTSMEAIEEKYFNFAIAGQNDPIQRERAYCAELYHQIRIRQQEIPGNYTINSEPDKKRHPIIEDKCGPVDPDLIIHHGGDMGPEDNLAVIEVKTSKGDLTDGIKKDLGTINCMTTIENGYYGGIIIVFGELTELRRKNLIQRIEKNKFPDVSRLTLCLQYVAGTQPELIEF